MTTFPAIVTHDGNFHSDDVFAVATLLMTEEFSGHYVIRTRDKTEIAKAAVVVDVGFVYNPAARRFDHHQSDAPSRPDGTPYSAFGLVWRSYGRHAIRHAGRIVHESDAVEIARIIDEGLVRSIDLADNGRIAARPYDIETLIGALNSLPPPAMTNFDAAVDMAKTILKGQIARAAQVVTDRAIVRNAIGAIPKGYPILELPISCENWREPVCAHNKHFPDAPILFVLQERNGDWGATGVPPTADSREVLAPFERTLCGLDEEALANRGHPDVLFVHRNAFFCISRTREATMALVNGAIEALRRAA